ncbi:MAG: hypothetical protein JWM27_74 [Gemmatimonadetes bacterium]|nr:hypothetical protein [Gemmatimonadota bacterium]
MILRTFIACVLVAGLASRGEAQIATADYIPDSSLLHTGSPIAGFASTPWGASRSAVIRRLGAPRSVQRLAGTDAIVYHQTVLHYRATAVYLFRGDDGLVAGMYNFDLPMNADCEAVYDAIASAIASRYPNDSPLEEKTNASSLSFCDGVLIGKAAAQTAWLDAQGNSASVSIDSEHPRRVFVLYSTRLAFDGVEAANAAEVRRQF